MGSIEYVSDYWGDPPDPDFETMDAEQALTFACGVARMQARLEARRLQALERVARLREGDEWIAEHVALETRMSIGRADRDLGLAHALTHRLPNTLAALRAGELDRARVDTIDHATSVLSDEQAHAVDTQLFPRALALNPGQLARFVRKLVAQVDPEGAAERAQSRQQERRVAIEPDPDGMSWLTAYLKSEDAVACWDRINRLARDITDPERSANQIRADVVRDLLLGTAASTTTAHIYVTIDAKTLLGLAQHPGEVRGYGLLPAERIRELAYQLHAEWSGVLVDDTGQAVRIAERKYRFRGRLAELIRLRDRTCTHPACNRAAEFTDIDHTIPFQRGGPTNQLNGHCLCRRHHRAKQSPLWAVTQRTDGASLWTSTTGSPRTYASTLEPITSPPPF